MKEYKVAVLGATGAVGQEMIKILEERLFPVKELVPLASARSAGKSVKFFGEDVKIRVAEAGAFEGCDIVLGAAENDISKALAPSIKSAGALYIDNSSAFRLDPEVPLIVPEVNGSDAFAHKGLIANPNCVTIIASMALAPIAKLSPIKTLTASSYQAVSGAGSAGLAELQDQVAAYAKGEELKVSAFAHQIAFNLIPKIGGIGDNGYSSEEMKLLNEGRKILHLPEMNVCCTCVRVPVFRSHAVSMQLTTEDVLDLDEVRKRIANFPGAKLVDDPNDEIYPMPLDTSDQDVVYVGRIRRDLINENGIALWCCGDQIRKGAATNAVQIAELFK
ncbi:MAG: aspartate-semialdehyde dehydrogenase [Clostridia bacterium]|nr:aspartate-semialdehyde dehydrogenase [Clostridia bacterium]